MAGLILAAAPVAVSPQIVQVACDYAPTIETSTTLTLTRYIASYGAITTASITVSAGAGGTPTGQVRLVVNGNSKGLKTLSASGTASYQLPRKLPAKRTHTIKAEYVGSCTHKASSATKKYTVFRARTTTKARVVSAQLAKFRARVIGSTGLVVRKGKVAFVVKKANGTKVRSGIRKVRRGVARIDMKNLPRGDYKVVARYLGSQNWKASRGVKRFRVS